MRRSRCGSTAIGVSSPTMDWRRVSLYRDRRFFQSRRATFNWSIKIVQAVRRAAFFSRMNCAHVPEWRVNQQHIELQRGGACG